VYQSELNDFHDLERTARASRLTAARLAVGAFASSPIHGLGWQRFPDYAARHADFGKLATHNDYLRVAAELGIAGIALFLILIATVLRCVVRLNRERVNRAATGILITGGVGLFFLNGIVAPNTSIPFAVAAAVACGAPSTRSRLNERVREPRELAAPVLH
jgi:O-antigen ligase